MAFSAELLLSHCLHLPILHYGVPEFSQEGLNVNPGICIAMCVYVCVSAMDTAHVGLG